MMSLHGGGSDFPHRPNGYDFINWLYCPECGGKAVLCQYSPEFKLQCDECGHEKTVVIGQTPPFHKIKPRDIEEGSGRHTENGPLPYQQMDPARKLREMDDTEVVRQLERAGYHDLADILSGDGS